MLEIERPAANFFEASYNFEWADRRGSAKLDRLVPSGRISKGERADLGDILVRNPTDRNYTRSIDASRLICIIET